jgi:hypothetical protein
MHCCCIIAVLSIKQDQEEGDNLGICDALLCEIEAESWVNGKQTTVMISTVTNHLFGVSAVLICTVKAKIQCDRATVVCCAVITAECAVTSALSSTCYYWY